MEEKPVSAMLKGIDKPFQASLLVINNLSLFWGECGPMNLKLMPESQSWCDMSMMGVMDVHALTVAPES